jgi:hypothetical protein
VAIGWEVRGFSHVVSFEFTHLNFTPRWKVLELVRKFLLTSAMIFFDQGSSAQVSYGLAAHKISLKLICVLRQVTVAVFVSVLFLALHIRYLPFVDNTDNWLQGTALVALCLVYFAGLLIKVILIVGVASF